MDIPLPGEVIPFPSSPPNIPKSPPPIPAPPDFDHIPLPPTAGKRQSPPTANHLSKAPPLPPVAPPLPPNSGKNIVGLPPLPGSQKGSSAEPKGNGEAILWQSIPPPPAPAPPPEDSRYSPSHATADEENDRVLFPASLTMLPPPPPPSDHSHPPSMRSPSNVPTNPPLPPTKPPLSSQPDHPSLPAPPPKTAVLGKTQAKKRLLAFSMTKHGGGQGLSFAIAKSTRVVNKASSNAFVGSGEDEDTSEKKEVVNKSRKKKKEEREVLAIEEIKREEERLKEALGIRQQTQSAQQWAEDMWGISPPVHEMMLPTLSAPPAASGEERDSANAGEGTTLTTADATTASTNQDAAGTASESHHNSELDANALGDTVISESANTERGEGAKAKGDGGDGKEERKEGSERREKKGERSSRKKDSGDRGRRRDEDGGDKERSKRERGGSGRSGRERRSDRKRESRRTSDGPPSGWKQVKEAGGEWSRERTSQRSREDRRREGRGSRSRRSRSRDQKRGGHSTHRSRSRSADGHRRPQASPFFIAKGAKHGEKEFPIRLLKHTKTKPPLSYCENPETAAPPQPTTRKEAFATEHPEVVNIMQVVTEAGSEKDAEGKEQAAEPSGLAALRVSYEGGDEDEGEDETKKPERGWFPDASSFLAESEVRIRHDNNNSLEEDSRPVRVKEEEASNEFDTIPAESISTNLKDISEDDEEENMQEEKIIDKRLLLNESESVVHSRWDSDPDSRGMSALEVVEKCSDSPITQEMEEEKKISERGERKRVTEKQNYTEAKEGSDSDGDVGSDNSEEDSEIEEKKGQQLASEYEEFMKAVSVGGEEDDAGDWGSGGDGRESGDDHHESDSSEHNSSKQNNKPHARSSDIEMGSDVHSSDEEAQNIAKHSSSESDNSALEKSKSGSETKKRIIGKEKLGKKKDGGKQEESDGGCDSDGEMQVPRKKRKLSVKKPSGSGELPRKRGSEERKKKFKVKEKSQKKKREKEKKRKKKKEKKKKKVKKKEDSSEMESESEEASDDAQMLSSGKSGRTKQGEKKRHRKGEQSSDEASTDNSSDSSDEEEKKRKKRKKKRKRHSKEDGDKLKDEAGENVDEGKRSKVHSGRKKKSHESKNKRGGSDNSDCSEEKLEDMSHGSEKLKSNAICDESVNGKENGIEEGNGKGSKKQKLKERGRKKKRKGSPINTKKHSSSRRRSPSTSDGSPTPGRGSHSRENSSKIQGRRGGTNESGQSSLDSNSSGGNKKPGDSTESLRHWESGRVGVGRRQEEAQTTICEKGRGISNRISNSEWSCKEKNSRFCANKDKPGRLVAAKGKRGTSDFKRNLTEGSPITSSSSSSPSSLSSITSSSSSSDSSFSSLSDSTSSTSSPSSPSSSSTSSLSTSSSSSESSSVSSFPCSPSSFKAEVSFCEEPELIKCKRLPEEILSKHVEVCVSPELDQTCSPLSKDDSLEEDNISDTVCSMKLDSDLIHSQINNKYELAEDNEKFAEEKNDASGDSSSCQMGLTSASDYSPRKMFCESSKSEEFHEFKDRPTPKLASTSETLEYGQVSHQDQFKEHSPLKSLSKLGSSEPKFISNDNESSFRESSEIYVDGKNIASVGQRITALPTRPSRWDTRPIGSGMQAGSVGGKGLTQEWDLPMSGLPVLPVPFPTCQTKPIEELPTSIQGVPKPVASPWGIEVTGNNNVLPVLSSSDLPLNPIRGLADSTISDSELGGKCVGLGGPHQVLNSSKGNYSVSLERPLVADHRTISSENNEMVELYSRESDHFVQPAREGVNMYLESREHPPDDRLMEHDVRGYAVDDSCTGKKPESASIKFGAARKDYEQAVAPETEPAPTDWDDPEAFVGSGLGGIKSHVIQVGNFLQVVPSEQPIVSRVFSNPTTPVPAAVPVAVASSGVPLAPVPPAPIISGVPPVAAPVSSASVTYPSPAAPLSPNFQSPFISSPSFSVESSLYVNPVSPSYAPFTSPVSSNIPTSNPTVASLIPSLTTAVPQHASPTPALSQIPLVASLAPTSSCAGISQLPLDPAAFLGSLISHALAIEKQQQTLLQSQLVVVQNEEVPKEMPSAEKEVKKIEKRKKSKGNHQSTEKILSDDTMTADDTIMRSVEDDYDMDPEDIALIQEAISKVPGEEEDFAEQNNKITKVKEKKKKARAGNAVFPPATRGILIPPGMREKPCVASGGANRNLNSGNQGQRKSVMFADGVRPGDGTSPSAGEDLPSPPPPVRKVPKEKRLRKKKKIKVKIIRQIRMESAEEDDDEDDDASPPPPPPGSPPPSLFLHHLSRQSTVGCDGAIPNPASHYPYPSAPTMPPTHMFSQLQAQQQLPPTPNAAHVATGGSAVLPPNALPPRIPQWAPCT